jgi:DNA-binding transcriptional regulator YbjK
VSRSPSGDRGAQRREELLDATVVVLAELGPRGVTHRSVSAAAGASLGLTRYWFDSREGLIRAALEHLAARDVAAVTLAVERILDAEPDRDELVRDLARAFTRELARDRVRALARYELFLHAARAPALRPALQAWGAAYRHLIERVLCVAGHPGGESHAALVLDAVNGLLLEQLAVPRADFERAVLRPALGELIAGAAQRAGAVAPHAASTT